MQRERFLPLGRAWEDGSGVDSQMHRVTTTCVKTRERSFVLLSSTPSVATFVGYVCSGASVSRRFLRGFASSGDSRQWVDLFQRTVSSSLPPTRQRNLPGREDMSGRATVSFRRG